VSSGGLRLHFACSVDYVTPCWKQTLVEFTVWDTLMSSGRRRWRGRSVLGRTCRFCLLLTTRHKQRIKREFHSIKQPICITIYVSCVLGILPVFLQSREQKWKKITEKAYEYKIHQFCLSLAVIMHSARVLSIQSFVSSPHLLRGLCLHLAPSKNIQGGSKKVSC